MKSRKIPMRTCIISKEKLPKQELIRIVKNNTGEVFIDPTGKSNGRGAYLKKDLEIIEKAKKTKILEKNLETTIPDEIYEQLKSMSKQV